LILTVEPLTRELADLRGKGTDQHELASGREDDR
jgi:hypothetical protein